MLGDLSLGRTSLPDNADAMAESLVVDTAPMADLDDEDNELAVVELTQDAIVADAIAPELSEIASKSLAELTRIFASLNSLVEEIDDPLASLGPQLA